MPHGTRTPRTSTSTSWPSGTGRTGRCSRRPSSSTRPTSPSTAAASEAGSVNAVAHVPEPADFAPPPTAADLNRWAEADRAARPGRLARLRGRVDGAEIKAYLAGRPGDSRYLSGLVLGG